MDRKRLLEARAELVAGLRASEEWQPSYKKSPGIFRYLTRLEADLETDIAEYFKRLSERAVTLVDWTLLPTPSLQAAAVPTKNDDAWAAEEADLTQAIIEAITALVALGAQAGESTYDIDLGITPL